MISFNQIEELMKARSDKAPLVSLYLGANGHTYVKKDYEIVVKGLLKEKDKELENQEKEKKASLEKDFEKIRQFIKYEFDWKGKKGLALFSCSASQLWQVYPLPQPVKNTLIIDQTPYIRPLIALFDEYRRLCIVLVDKSKARIFEVFLGEITEHTEIVDETPRKAKTGGWKGNEEGRIQRHLTEEVHRHFKRVTDALMDSFKLYHFDNLVLGGHRPDFSEFESELHPSLKDRIIGRLELDLHTSQETVLEKAMSIEQAAHKENSEKLVKRLSELTGERMAVTGILATLTVHRRGQIHQLVVSNNYQVPGAKCSSCGYLDQENRDCPVCKKPLGQIPDLVDDLIESVVSQGGKVEYVCNNEQMKQLGGVGAILRFKI